MVLKYCAKTMAEYSMIFWLGLMISILIKMTIWRQLLQYLYRWLICLLYRNVWLRGFKHGNNDISLLLIVITAGYSHTLGDEEVILGVSHQREYYWYVYVHESVHHILEWLQFKTNVLSAHSDSTSSVKYLLMFRLFMMSDIINYQIIYHVTNKVTGQVSPYDYDIA